MRAGLRLEELRRAAANVQREPKPVYPRPLPRHVSDPVALVKQRIVSGGETGILEEDAALQTLSLQGGVVLPLEGPHRGEHAAEGPERRRVTVAHTVTHTHNH